MKKLLTLLLTVALCFSTVACTEGDLSNLGNSSSAGSNATLNDVEIWGVSGTEKVLRNVHNIYNAVKDDAHIELDVAKGEYEAEQIIITAKGKDVKYLIETTDLVSSSGKTFPKNNIEVFVEKYVTIYKNYDKTTMPLGDCPDCLVPYDGIVLQKENIVKATNNQGIYVRFNVPVSQEAGLYTGKIKIKIGKETAEYDINLNVNDVVVSQESHARSLFSVRGLFQLGELEHSQRMYDLYNEALYEYRINTNGMIKLKAYNDAELENYINTAYERMQNPKVNTVILPTKYKTLTDTETGINVEGLDEDALVDLIKKIAKKSFDNNFNMAEKFVVRTIDEPQYKDNASTPVNEGMVICRTVTTTYRNAIKRAADEIQADSTITSPIKDEFVASVRKIPNIITMFYNEDYAPYVDCWCPTYDYYDAGKLELYENKGEKWWYGCIDPRAPYPTYHTEDSMLSPRLVGWMMAEYEVVGNLFWGVDVYANYVGDDLALYEHIEDYYEGTACRYQNVNGDGYLFYPGKKYLVDGPLPSMRIEAIRDGSEEFEILYEMMNKYSDINEEVTSINSAYSFDERNFITSITRKLYTGTKISGTSDDFAEARALLFEVAKLNQAVDFCVLDYQDDNKGNVTYKLLAHKDAVATMDGQPLTIDATVGNYNFYTVTKNLSSASNSIVINFVKDGKTHVYNSYVGGKVSSYKFASDFASTDFIKLYSNPTVETVSGSSIGVDYNVAKVTLGKVAKDQIPRFLIKGKLASEIGRETSKIIMRVYSEETINFVVSTKFKKETLYKEFAAVTLGGGITEIQISFAAINWDKVGDVESFLISVGEKNDAPQPISFIDLVIYNK